MSDENAMSDGNGRGKTAPERPEVPIVKDQPEYARPCAAHCADFLSSMWFFHRGADYSMVSARHNRVTPGCPRQTLASA